MSNNKPYSYRSAFDDRGMPAYYISAERVMEIEKLILPGIVEALEKLRLEKPHLFTSPEKPVLYSDLETKEAGYSGRE